MRIKKYLSLFLVIVLALGAVAGGYVVSADAVGETVTYSYMVKANTNPAAFEGTLYYPADKLEVIGVAADGSLQDFDAVLGQGYAKDNGGEIVFNNTNAQYPFDLSDYVSLITVQFEVKSSFDNKDISVELDEIYSTESIMSGNIPYYFKNYIDGDRVSSGYVDLDDPANSYDDPDNIDYTVVYTYKDTPTSYATLTKAVNSPSEDALTVADLGLPKIENPYYTYTLGSASVEAGNVIGANLTAVGREYNITYNNVTTKAKYMESYTAETEEAQDFLMDGVVVATGKEFSFFVTGDAVIATQAPTGKIEDSATIVRKALSITDNPNNAEDKRVKMEFLATVKSNDFARMGVAFALSERSDIDVIEAVSAVKSGSSVSNKISVYNSAVDYPNKSGQYQFIYAPFASASALADKTLYFYTFGVDKQGNVTVSDYNAVDMATVLA